MESVTNNPNFPNPDPPLVTVQAALTAYDNALIAAGGLDRTKVALKNEARAALEVLAARLGMYVMNVGLGNVAVLTSSGFTVIKETEPIYITNPGSVNIANGITSGELKVSVKTVKGAKSYVFQLSSEAPVENTEWTSYTTSRSRYTFTNLQPGKQYWVRVAVIGAREQVAYSPVGSQFAQ